MTVLVLTNRLDPTADRVIKGLRARAVGVVRLDPGDLPEGVAIEAEHSGRAWRGRIFTAHHSVLVDDITAVYVRRPNSPRVLGSPTDPDAYRTYQWAARENHEGLYGVLFGLPGVRWANRPDRNRTAGLKGYQLATAAACGFAVPPTLFGNTVSGARRFVGAQGEAVYKPLRGAPERGGWQAMALYTRAVSTAELDESVRGAVCQFQRRIRPRYEARVTVVGDRVFTARLDSPTADGAVDWRQYQGTDQLVTTLIDTPAGLARSIHRYMRVMGLNYGCFDFMVDAADRWWFLECNPSGQYLGVENETGAPVTRAVVDWLAGAPGAGARN
ncbi:MULTISPECIES: MvdC/MvdD family ATP grasp protein [Kitasatospora]|uniref:MvdD-like pre-ATP grasp domain-containing protein n=1 Tax=Kitasatospora setae (strain ATCC 33774 / DSM 43861 / JCM 3304 / KCC A-0304 / NBRC 14216 / KM-6054) TaxID=452652 RepID=E4NEB1_KITSK|nr:MULTISPECIES: hypothetical protein [Kitasatospora]BAJ29542.1 hypothetical protein KSE_37420 [Kitasatospora setae KM-6054]